MMRHINSQSTIIGIVFLSFLGIKTYSQTANAQFKISQLEQKDSLVELTITSNEHIRNGANPYVLYIDGKQFMKCKEPANARGMKLTFYIPLNDFNNLSNSAQVTLVYGLHDKNLNIAQAKTGSFIGKNWLAGKLDKSILTR